MPGRRAHGVLLALAALAAAGCSANVLSGIDERSANEALTALERAGIPAEKIADDGAAAGGPAAAFTIQVARGDGARALDVLRASGLPRERRRGFAETYGQPSLIPTASEERARYVGALAGEVERTLESVDGVVSARVHLVPDEPDPLAIDPGAPGAPGALGARPRNAGRAAVLLKTRAAGPPIAAGDVQKLVAGSVPGLEPAAVVVVTTAAAAPEQPAAVWAQVGPLRVAPASRPLVLAALAISLGVLAALAGLLLVTSRRLAAVERGREKQPETGEAPRSGLA